MQKRMVEILPSDLKKLQAYCFKCNKKVSILKSKLKSKLVNRGGYLSKVILLKGIDSKKHNVATIVDVQRIEKTKQIVEVK